MSGKKKYNNGKIARYFIPGTQPEGWVLGSTKEKNLKTSIAIKNLWKNEEYKNKRLEFLHSQEWKDFCSVSSKEWWKEHKEERMKSIKSYYESYSVPKEKRDLSSKKMKELWSNESYRLNQVSKLKEGHQDLYKKHPEYLDKISSGNKKSWNENKEVILQKQYNSKSKNNSWNTSKLEEEYYEYLINKYSTEDIVRQYRDERYPFYCDFYIKSEDKFIEIQGTWLHGGHFFDCNDPQDIAMLNEWKEKAEKSNYYKNAIKVWTEVDIKKRQIALDNNLNIEFIF